MNIASFETMRDQNPFAPLNDLVYQFVLDAVISFQLQPGDRVSANKLSQDLGVSRSPVTAALEKLCEDGFVYLKNGRYYVTELDEQTCKEMSDFMMMVEPYAAGEAAVNISKEELDELYKIAYRLRDLYAGQKESQDPEIFTKIVEQELAFHSLVVKSSGNALITGIYDSMKYKLFRFRGYAVYHHSSEYSTLDKDHVLICNILKLGDRDLAAAIARRHLTVSQSFTG